MSWSLAGGREHGVQASPDQRHRPGVCARLQTPMAERSCLAFLHGYGERADPRSAGCPRRRSDDDRRLVVKKPKTGTQEAQDGGGRTDTNGGRLQDWESAVLGVLGACAERRATGGELLAGSGYSTRTGDFERRIERHLAMNLLELTIPDKPRRRR